MQKKILIVDDSLTARRLLAQYLQGNTVLEASNGIEALDILDQHPTIAFAFVDINMPWMDGLEFLKKIREKKDHQKLPICILTTETEDKALEEAKKLGADAFVIKPAAKDQVLSLIKNLASS